MVQNMLLYALFYTMYYVTSVRETLTWDGNLKEYRFWGLNICVDLIKEIRNQKENLKKPYKIICLNKNISIYNKTDWPHLTDTGFRACRT